MIRTGAQLCAICGLRERAFLISASQPTSPPVGGQQLLILRISVCPECAGYAQAGGLSVMGRPATVTGCDEIPVGIR